jgi:hypothetical protein
VTSGWPEGEPLIVEAPDFSGLDGWDDAFGLVTGEAAAWTLYATGTNRDVAFALFGFYAPSDGTALPGLDGGIYRETRLNGELLP